MIGRSSVYKKIVLLLSILFGILYYGYYLDSLSDFKIEKSDVYRVGHEIKQVEHLITPSVENITIRLLKSDENVYKRIYFNVIECQKQRQWGYLFYIKHIILLGIISVFYRIIIYIHNKDGPKRVISPT